MQCVHRQRQMVRSIPLVEFRALGFALHLRSNHRHARACRGHPRLSSYLPPYPPPHAGEGREGEAWMAGISPAMTPAAYGQRNRKTLWLADKHSQRIEQRLWIVLTLIHWRRRGAALEQDVDRLPRRADGAFDGEGYFPRNLDILTDESEIGRPLWNRGRPVAADPGEPDIVNIRHVARHANRRRHDRGQVPVEPKVPQRLLQDLRAGALVHAFAHKIAGAFGIQTVAPPDARARRLADDFWLVEDGQRQ